MTVSWNWSATPDQVMAFDFETQSLSNIRKDGARRYIMDPSTRVSLCGFSYNGHRTMWVIKGVTPANVKAPTGWDLHIGDTPPQWVQDAIKDDVVLMCHNADFDVPVWEKFVRIPATFVDSLPMCRAAGLPGSLDKACKILFGEGKSENHALINVLCVARPKGETIVYPMATAAAWSAFIEYCSRDVELLERLYKEVYTYAEPAVLDVDRKVNDRGIPVDTALAARLVLLREDLMLRRAEEFSKMTDGELDPMDARSSKKVTDWIHSLGIRLPTIERKGKQVETLDKKELNRLLREPEAFFEGSDDSDLANAVAALKVRFEVTGNAGGKALAFVKAADADQRARNQLVFHGAHTARWTGRQMQPHNLFKGVGGVDLSTLTRVDLTIEDIEVAAKAASKPDKTVSCSDLLSSLLRPCIYSEKGLGISDFGAVEARGVAWLADEEADLKEFAKWGADPYLPLASQIFGRTITKNDSLQRWCGKQAILGCLAEGTPILTDNGWKSIETVELSDRVWDGVEWVNHDGVVFQGYKEVIDLNGVQLTPDHKVLTDEGMVEAWHLQGSTSFLKSVMCTQSGRLFVSSVGKKLSADAPVGGLRQSTYKTSTVRDQRGAINAQLKRLHKHNTLRCLQYVKTLYYVEGCLTGFVQSSLGAYMIHHTAYTTRTVASSFINHGLKIGLRSCHICSHCLDTMIQGLRLIVSITTDTMNQVICALRHEANNATINGVMQSLRRFAQTEKSEGGSQQQRTMQFTRAKSVKSGRMIGGRSYATLSHYQGSITQTHNSGESTSHFPVHLATYDLLNAGPRHRFQVPGMIVSNCGYNMSYRKFLTYCAVQGVDLAKVGVDAKKVVDLYRQTHPNIKKAWSLMHDAMLAAIDGVDAHVCKCYIYRDSVGVNIQLPSGRKIVYRNARMEMQIPAYAKLFGIQMDPQPTFTFLHPHGYVGSSYGGRFLENCCQALCRDILADRLVAIEKAGLNPVLHVHDEVVTEGTDVHELARIMSIPPSWASSFPLYVEAFKCDRYLKSPPKGTEVITALMGEVRQEH